MTGGLRDVWEYLDGDLWLPLAEYSREGYVAPDSLFVDLFKAVDDFLSPGFSRSELEEAGNDPDVAEVYFRTLKGTDFSSELAIVQFLEEVNAIVVDYDTPGYGEHYQRLIERLLSKFNLRYRITNPFKLRFLLPASFSNLYAEIQRVNMTSQDLTSLLEEFEIAFDVYARDQTVANMKVCIAKTSNYVEGLASAAAGYPSSHNTLGALINTLQSWPNEHLRKVLTELWLFCSDYPGIRHAGQPAHAARALEGRDLVLTTIAMFSFAGHLSTNVDAVTVLGA